MLWMIMCTDKPNQAEKRAELLAAHRKYLDGKNDMIFFSGPQESDDGSRMIGSLFIVSAPAKKGAEDFIYNETFYQAGVFADVAIRRVRKGRFFPERIA
ncbi:hypothetical protein CEY11_11575 [Candidimonas nitroreducens]|uniref:YCII-related domain-containing protein n=2 Tax=Candidimonas nitroreducens TaxID=683354 RepID=A0A225MGA7_9BURK|nr:hypothetical protein CEY11_11575 [Candidimonas nitroreducens]